MYAKTLLATACALAAPHAAGQADWQLLQDVYPGSTGGAIDTLGATATRVYFVGRDTGNNYQLWSTDGTPGGTGLVKQATTANPAWFPRFKPGAAIGDVLVFALDDGFTGLEPWRTDGTTDGTTRVADIVAGGGHASPNRFVAFRDRVLFNLAAAPSGTWVHGSSGTTSFDSSTRAGGTATMDGQLWYARGGDLARYDGVAGAPTIIEHVASIADVVALNDKLVIVAADPANGTEIWVSGGTAASTTLLRDLNPGTTSSFPQYLTRVDDFVYFTAMTADFGSELWRTDGTVAGTMLVADVAPGTLGSAPDRLAAHAGRLFFSADDGNGRKLWTTDGTPAGTSVIAGGFSYTYNRIEPLAGRLLVSFPPGGLDPTNVPHYYDDTTGTLKRLGTTALGAAAGPNGGPVFYAASGRIVARGFVGQSGDEPFAIDPVAAIGPHWCEMAELALPDLATTTSRAILPSGATIASLSVSLDAFHATLNDLRVTLRHVDTGTSVVLFDPGCTSDLVDVTFDDDAAAGADTSCAATGRLAFPRDTTWKPTQSLAAFAGEGFGGTWELEVVDQTFRNAGVLHQWCLTAAPAAPPPDPVFANGFE